MMLKNTICSDAGAMLLAHRIRIDPTHEQREYFARAAGTACRVWNWGLAESLRQVASGGKPNAMALKRQFNAIKYLDPAWLDANGLPWLRSVHRDAHAQPFANLAKAWSRYFAQCRAGEKAHPPRFKKKGRCTDSFYLANDKFRLEFRRQLQYKAPRYGTDIVLTDRWYPSSKLCSHCGVRNATLSLGGRTWTCAACGAHHDRDLNAAINLQRLATGALAARTALPEASRAVTPGTAAGTGPAGGGKVTPVRDEHGQQDGSGQEENSAHFCAHSC